MIAVCGLLTRCQHVVTRLSQTGNSISRFLSVFSSSHTQRPAAEMIHIEMKCCIWTSAGGSRSPHSHGHETYERKTQVSSEQTWTYCSLQEFLKETFSEITHRWNDCCSKKIMNENSPVSFPFSHFLLFSFISFVFFSFIRGDKHTFILCRRVVETPILTTTTTTLLFAVTGYNAYRRHWEFHKWGEIMMYVIKKHSVKTRGVLKLDVLKGLVL